MPSVQVLLEAAQPLVGKTLLPPAAWAHVWKAAAGVPSFADGVGVECRLTGGKERVDLGVALHGRGRAPRCLQEPTVRQALAVCAGRDRRWQPIRAFLHEWSEKSSPLAQRVPYVFLEFDCVGRRTDGPAGMFAALDWAMTELAAEPAGNRRTAALCGAAISIIGTRLGCSLSDTERHLLEHAIGTLPTGGLVANAGLFLGRTPRSLRLSLLLPRRSVRTYLHELQWPGPGEAIEQLLARYAPLCGFAEPAARVQTDFDLPARGWGLVGVSLYPRTSTGWPFLLALLVADGSCDPEKLLELLAWPGVPPGKGEPRSTLCRYLSHVKLSLSPSGALSAKAYLGIVPTSQSGADP